MSEDELDELLEDAPEEISAQARICFTRKALAECGLDAIVRSYGRDPSAEKPPRRRQRQDQVFEVMLALLGEAVVQKQAAVMFAGPWWAASPFRPAGAVARLARRVGRWRQLWKRPRPGRTPSTSLHL
jgi:hypothetical protein